MMLITPPMASEPYSEDMGPRTTSMRSIISGEIQFKSWRPRSGRYAVSAELPMRLPSTRIKVYLSGKPRSLIFDSSPVGLVPPVTPGLRRSSVLRSYTGWRSISSRVMTLILAGASLMSMAVPDAVTTTVFMVGSAATLPSAQALLTASDSRQGRSKAARTGVATGATVAGLRWVMVNFPDVVISWLPSGWLGYE